MTTVVSVLNKIARRCHINAPSSWISATQRSHVELRDDFLLDTIDDLRKRIDFPEPIGAQVVITGDGTTEDHDLPSQFLRMQKGDEAFFETTSTRRCGTPVHTAGDWTYLKEIGTGSGRYFRLIGNEGDWQISIYPILGAAESVTISYVTNYWMETSGGTAGASFTDADDVLLFPSRPVELGTIYRWRQDKGLEHAALKAEYEMWIATTANRVNRRKTVNIGEPALRKPMREPVPDFIPSS